MQWTPERLGDPSPDGSFEQDDFFAVGADDHRGALAGHGFVRRFGDWHSQSPESLDLDIEIVDQEAQCERADVVDVPSGLQCLARFGAVQLDTVVPAREPDDLASLRGPFGLEYPEPHHGLVKVAGASQVSGLDGDVVETNAGGGLRHARSIPNGRVRP